MNQAVELEDLIRAHEAEEKIYNMPQIAALSGRLCMLLGFVIGMQMPEQQTLLLTTGALLLAAWFAISAWRNPGRFYWRRGELRMVANSGDEASPANSEQAKPNQHILPHDREGSR